MTHLLPGGGVPRVHGAQSAVLLRLLLLATPRSVHHLAAVAAGTYPPRHPPNAWLPGVPAPPGPCYWVVASGTPFGWRGGCLAAGLVRGAVRHYCPGGCNALFMCARRSRPVRGELGRCRVLCLPRFPLPAPRFPRCAWRAVPSGCPLSSLAGCHSMRSVCSAGSVRLPFWYSPRVPCLCVRSRSRGVRAPPPPWVGVVRAPHAVPVLGAGRAVPRGACPFACSALVPCSVWLALGGGGRPGPLPPLPGLWLCAPLWAGPRVRGIPAPGGRGGGGGAAYVPSCPKVRPGRPEGRGVTLPRSVSLPSLGRQQSGCH